MKRFVVPILALSLLTFFSCKKEENTNVTDTSATTTASTGTTSTAMTDTSATTSTSTTATAAPITLNDEEKKFVTDAANDNMAEVALGQMASSKATNADVKAFGDRMVTDHSKVLDEIKSLAASASLTLPSQPDAKSQKVADDLSKKSGKDFDKAYMDEMVKGHEKDVAEFKKEAASTKDDAPLKAWSTKTLPTLEDHLKMAKDTQKKVK